MAGFEINKRAIENMQREIAKEFERAARKHPIRVPVQVDTPRNPACFTRERRHREGPTSLASTRVA